MAEEQARPNPDELLARVKAEEEQTRRGRLKIFLGYIAGVGKTYTMLEAAHQRQKDTDVVVAYVETHDRRDTKALLEGLEIIPRRTVDYRGVKLSEMDIDAVLARRPQLALVDELAHENAPGSRHPKRYQDVEELLGAGIDVYTTLNIQHIESGRNIVAQVTGVWVRESVPDSIIDLAAEIELVDLPPDELIKRLQEGKVYIPEQIAAATDRFFRKENLTALRELTMRAAARHVDEQTQDYLKTHGILGPWPSGERILLFIGPGSSGSRLVRSARRLAYELGVEWSALYVENPGSARLPQGQQERIMESLRLAQRLGAKVVTIQRDAIAPAVAEYLKTNNITKLVLAKPPRKSFWKMPGGSVADQIIDRSADVDVHLVSVGGERVRRDRRDRIPLSRNWREYLQGFGMVVLATLLGKAAPNFFSDANMIMVYLLCVGATAFLWGFGPSILVSLLSVLSFDFLFVVPFYTFTVNDTRYVFTFIVLLAVGLAISYFTRRIRQHTEVIMSHEQQTTALYALGRDLAVSNDLASYVRAITTRAKESFGRDAVIFLPDRQKEGALKPYGDGPGMNIDENELAAAAWSFEHQKVAGPGTDTLPNAGARYLPLVTTRGALGVLALSMSGTGGLTIEQERLLEAYADLTAVAIESVLLGQEALDAQVLRNTEKLQTSLLNAISHDLRTPLVSVIGTLSGLQEEGINLDDAARKNLIQVAREEAERLNHLITNLLDESRIEAGAITLSRQPAEVQDLVGAALEQLGSRARARSINIDIPAKMPFVNVDFGLTVQTLVNILDNALKYSPPDTPIEIRGRRIAGEVEIEIADHGAGIPPQDLPQIFDKFYRIKRPDNVAGMGLGLSISKGIVEAHGGRIEAENAPGGGTTIRITIPLAEPISGAAKKRHE
jgi:two-component system sensor histidine kinase KdpD